MKKMFKYFTLLAGIAISFSSCLKQNLPGVNDSNQNNITDFGFLYKYQDTSRLYVGTPKEQVLITVQSVTLNISKKISNDTVYVTPTFPGNFPVNEKSKVSISKIWGYASIPNAATIAPINGAPELGKPGDFTQAVSYVVTAANGETRKWVIVTKPLPLVNQYEGNYDETGYFDHPTAPRALNATKYMSSVDANTIAGDLADLGGSGYTITVKINADNSCIVSQFVGGNPLADSEMVPGAENKYYPAEKKFVLNYRYMGGNGWRTINATLKQK